MHWAASVESVSEHPYAKAIHAEAIRRGVKLDEPSDFDLSRGAEFGELSAGAKLRWVVECGWNWRK